MTAITYDTHAAVKRLMQQGFSDSQAEAVVGEVASAQVIDPTHIATKEDLKKFATKEDMLSLEVRLTRWMLGGFVGVFSMLLVMMIRLS